MPATVITAARRRRLVDLRQEGCSLHAIADELEISVATAHNVVRRLSASGELEQPERVDGLDGKKYRSQRERER